MKILPDECVPAKLRTQLPQEHEVTTVPRMGWSGTKNGVLLEMADQQFDVFITADRHVYDQQNLSGLRVAVLVIPTNNSRIVQQLIPALLQSLDVIKPGMYVTMDVGRDSDRWPELRLQEIAANGRKHEHIFRVGGRSR
jgi:predicted nuclease of predicted toxin-antitoxin system